MLSSVLIKQLWASHALEEVSTTSGALLWANSGVYPLLDPFFTVQVCVLWRLHLFQSCLEGASSVLLAPSLFTCL